MKTGEQRDEHDLVLRAFPLIIFITAWTNGATVLYAQMLQAPSKLQQSPTVRLVDLSRVFLLLLYRFLLFLRWRRSLSTSGYLRKRQDWAGPLYSQAILFSARALFRWAFGFSALHGVKLLDPDEAEGSFGLQRYRENGNDSTITGRFSWGLSIVTVLLLSLREWALHRGANIA